MAKPTFYRKKRFQIQLYAVLSLILIIFLGFYGFTNVTKMLDMRSQKNLNFQLHSSLKDTDERVAEELSKVKKENKVLSQQIQNELDLVFPRNENHTVLTRTLEQFEADFNRTLNPFIINSLQYQQSQKSKTDDYSLLPFKMTLHSSYDNFFAFLNYVENSGVLNDKTRLLDIESIVINFTSPQGAPGNLSGQNEINFNVSMKAAFRSTDDI